MSETVPQKKGPLAAFAPFTKPFWVINGVELFERGAYYGMLSVLAVFISIDLAFPAWLTGVLLAIQFPLLYFLPVASGAMAYKFGFKKLLIATFAFLIAGYLVLSVATNFALGLLGIVLYGIGAGLFKPMPAATVSDTTEEKDRNFGFAIYYWMINLGAFLLPLGMQQFFGGSYRPYFIASAALSVVNLVICLALWKDIRPPNPSVKIGEALRRVGDIRQHPTFAVLILIYSGFWFMYAITTSYLQIYAVQYGIISAADVALLVPINALAILIVGPILSKITGKMPSLPLMIAGITIFCIGFLVIGFIPTLIAIFVGVFIYSIGEFLTHPSYLSYVSKISPPDKVPLFLGYGFIAVGIGQFAGTLAGGFLYGMFAEQGGLPQQFWVSIVSVGLLTVAALLIYNAFMVRRAAPRPEPSAPAPRRSYFSAPVLAALAILLVPALFAAGAVVQPPERGEDIGALSVGGGLVTLALDAVAQTTAEGETTTVPIALPANATGNATVVLRWTDEPAGGQGRTNQPDQFRVHVVDANGAEVASSEAVANAVGSEGTITVTFAAAPGDYVIHVELVDAGDSTSAVSNVPVIGGQVGSSADVGNAWSLELTHEAQATGA